MKISREGFSCEKTTEYKEKVDRGINPYPSRLPWHPVAYGLMGNVIPSMMAGYPYSAKILVNWQANPLYTTPGLYRNEVIEFLKDTKKLPLFISIDTVMGETTAYADYVIPDTTFFESWGVPSVWNALLTKVSASRWPVVESLTPKLQNGRVMCLETFLIDVAVRLGLPGFGDKAIPDAAGRLWPLHKREDFFLKVLTNVAFDEKPVPDVDPDDVKVAALDEVMKRFKDSLQREEWPKVGYVLARGGRFEDYSKGYRGDELNHQFSKILAIYSEKVGASRNSLTGDYFNGTAVWVPPAFSDNRPVVDEIYKPSEWPFEVISYKSRFRTNAALANVELLRDIKETNYIEISRVDAERLHIKSGDLVKVITPTKEIQGEVKVRYGLMPGTMAIAFGYGHWQYGGRDYRVGDKTVRGDSSRSKGVLINLLSLQDPSTRDLHPLTDLVGWATARNDIRAKLVKLS